MRNGTLLKGISQVNSMNGRLTKLLVTHIPTRCFFHTQIPGYGSYHKCIPGLSL